MSRRTSKTTTIAKEPSLVEKARLALLSCFSEYSPQGWFTPAGDMVEVIKKRIFRCTGLKHVKLRLVNENNRYVFTTTDTEECYFFSERTGVVTKVEKLSYRQLVRQLDKAAPAVAERLAVPGPQVGMVKCWREQERFLRDWNGGSSQTGGVSSQVSVVGRGTARRRSGPTVALQW